MPLLSYIHQLFSAEQCQAYIHTLRWKDRPLHGHRCHSHASDPSGQHHYRAGCKRYRCTGCKRTFNELTETLLQWSTRPLAYGSVTKRLLCIPVPSTYACKTRREGKGHWGPHVAIKRCRQSQVWHAVAGVWAGMSRGAEGGGCALLCSFSRLAEVRRRRQTHTPFHVKLRPREPIEPSRERNLFVTLPVVNATSNKHEE